jgi:hypothetical protein
MCGRTEGCGADEPRRADAVLEPDELPPKRLPSEKVGDSCFCSERNVDDGDVRCLPEGAKKVGTKAQAA